MIIKFENIDCYNTSNNNPYLREFIVYPGMPLFVRLEGKKSLSISNMITKFSYTIGFKTTEDARRALNIMNIALQYTDEQRPEYML